MRKERLFLFGILVLLSFTFISSENLYDTRSGTSIQTINNITINGSSVNHSQLSNLQGGNTSEYYHLNVTDWDNIKKNQFLWVTASAGNSSFNQSYTNLLYHRLNNGTFTSNITTIGSVLGDNLCYANGTGCSAGGNSSWNQSYANTLYFGIGNWNATNTTYRTLTNGTYIGNWNATGTVYSEGINNLTIGFLHNSTGWIRDWGYLTTGLISNSTMNKSVSCSDIFGADADFCVDAGGDNSSLVLKNTNWNSTNDLVPALNISYGLGNSTNMFNHIFVKTLNLIDKITGSQIANSAITSALVQAGSLNATHISIGAINNSHIQAGAINVTQIGVGAVNTTGILDNTILPIDLHSDINLTYLRNQTGINITQMNVTFSYLGSIGAVNCPTTIRGSKCRNNTGTYEVG